MLTRTTTSESRSNPPVGRHANFLRMHREVMQGSEPPNWEPHILTPVPTDWAPSWGCSTRNMDMRNNKPIA